MTKFKSKQVGASFYTDVNTIDYISTNDVKRTINLVYSEEENYITIEYGFDGYIVYSAKHYLDKRSIYKLWTLFANSEFNTVVMFIHYKYNTKL